MTFVSWQLSLGCTKRQESTSICMIGWSVLLMYVEVVKTRRQCYQGMAMRGEGERGRREREEREERRSDLWY